MIGCCSNRYVNETRINMVQLIEDNIEEKGSQPQLVKLVHAAVDVVDSSVKNKVSTEAFVTSVENLLAEHEDFSIDGNFVKWAHTLSTAGMRLLEIKRKKVYPQQSDEQLIEYLKIVYTKCKQYTIEDIVMLSES